VQQVGFSLHDYIEMHGQQNLNVVTKYQWSLIFIKRAETKGFAMLHHVG
jgi:hypothetical protein